MKNTASSFVGRHLIIEFWDCRHVNSKEKIKAAILKAVKDCGATLLKSYVHAFKPQGVSAVAVIAESHISVHTWPEKKYAAFDVFTCGRQVDPYLAFESLKGSLKPKNVSLMEIKRGVK